MSGLAITGEAELEVFYRFFSLLVSFSAKGEVSFFAERLLFRMRSGKKNPTVESIVDW